MRFLLLFGVVCLLGCGQSNEVVIPENTSPLPPEDSAIGAPGSPATNPATPPPLTAPK